MIRSMNDLLIGTVLEKNYEHIYSLYSDTKILSKYIPSLQKKI
jgi:hypothetical protein